MSHYKPGDWFDYVRGIMAERDAEAMTAHLETGCQECSEIFELLRRVATVAASAGPEVPQDVIRRAEAIFPRPPSFRFETLFPLVAQLVLEEHPEEQRNGIGAARTLGDSVYRAGNVLICLHQETDPVTGQTYLGGRISRDTIPEHGDNRLPIALFSRDTPITRSMSNQFGEFSLTYSHRPALKLAIAIPATGRKIEIPLSRSAHIQGYSGNEE